MNGNVARHPIRPPNRHSSTDSNRKEPRILRRLNPIALSVAQKWAKYKVNLGNRSLQALRRSAGFYSHWDDHEFVNDFSPAENSFDNGVNVNGRTLYKRGAQAFRDYAPVSWSSKDGLYRTVRWGRNLQLFFLDERSFRSANADANHVCDNPQTGQPAMAPQIDTGHSHSSPARRTPAISRKIDGSKGEAR